MVYVVACFHQWASSIIWIGPWRDIRLRSFYVFWHRHNVGAPHFGWSHGMNCSVLSPSTECYAFLKFLHLDRFVDGRYVDAVHWTLGDNQRSSSKLVVCRAIFWCFEQGTESPTKVSQGRQSDCHAISLSKNVTIRGPTLRPPSGSPDFFVPFEPCGVPFDRTIRVARGFAFAFAFGFACPS